MDGNRSSSAADASMTVVGTAAGPWNGSVSEVSSDNPGTPSSSHAALPGALAAAAAGLATSTMSRGSMKWSRLAEAGLGEGLVGSGGGDGAGSNSWLGMGVVPSPPSQAAVAVCPMATLRNQKQ